MGQRVAFIVPGKPKAWQRVMQRLDPKTGRLIRFNDPSVEAKKREIATEARMRWHGPPATGPVLVRVVAIFAIPPSWPEKLKAEARDCHVMHIADPDLDRIVNLVQDALVGIAVIDDNQFCGYPNSAKRYGEPERTEITVEVLDQLETQKTPGQRKLESRPPEERLISGSVANKLRRNRSKTKSRITPTEEEMRARFRREWGLDK